MDSALAGVLISDATLTGLMPDGVFFDVGGKDATKFVLIKLLSHADEYMFGGSAYEEAEYLVKAVSGPTSAGDLNMSNAVVKQAAARIHVLLQDAAITPTGYKLMRLQRTERVRYSEPDSANVDARWHHGGGQYSVWVSP